jgi:hypothetical protein
MHYSKHDKLSRRVLELCHSSTTLSSELAKDPREAPTNICKRLFEINPAEDDIEDKTSPNHVAEGASDIDQARACGKWGDSQPSELFLKVRGSLPEVLCICLTATDLSFYTYDS